MRSQSNSGSARSGLVALAIGVASLSAMPALACKCGWEGPFEHVAKGKTVVVVQVDAHVWADDRKSVPAAKATVVEVWRGSAPTQLMVLGDTGSECRINAAELKPNHRYLLVLRGAEGAARAVSSCGETVVPIESGAAVGKLIVSGRLPTAPPDDPFRRSRDEYADQTLSMQQLRSVVVAPEVPDATSAPRVP